MIIDKLGDKTYTEHELTYLAQDEIRTNWSADIENNLQRKLSGSALGIYTLSDGEKAEVAKYAADLKRVQEETAQAVIDNKLLIDTIAYEKALIRLQQYELSKGREAKTIYKESLDGKQEVDYVISAIKPLEPTVEVTVYDDHGDGTKVKIKNPLIEDDERERAEAQNIIDGVTAEISALFHLRNK